MAGNTAWDDLDDIFCKTSNTSRDETFRWHVGYLICSLETAAVALTLYYLGKKYAKGDAEDCYFRFTAKELKHIVNSHDPSQMPFRNYFKLCLYRFCVKYMRKHPPSISVDDQHNHLPELQMPQEGPEDIYRRKELAEIMSQAIEELPERQRRVMEGILAGKSGPQIAQELGVHDGYPKVIAMRARTRLRRKLKAQGVDINAV
jgi:RNA polymerase sigma factor (sigma-70 family)